MGIEDAATAADFIGCDDIIGMHYDTFGFIQTDHEAAQAHFAQSGKKLRLMKIGESINI
jgi:L-ascorbate metabolism protein UlaG (beta-lactamase superfamily)